MEIDWKKKYEDALERAKMILCNLGYGDKSISDIETVFPELAESEDEKIRKDIISLVNEWWDSKGTSHPEFSTRGEMLAYLEKQKEQKSEWSEEDENALNYLHELIGFGFTEKFCDAQTASDMREWLNTRLKSLKNRGNSPKSNTNSPWKPGAEQMRQLGYVAEQNKHNMLGKELMTLYNDLTKLL